MDTVGFTIKTVAEKTGVSVHTLRAWERRYGVPLPNRGEENRYRLYTDQDIADVLFMKQQVEKGVSPSQASALLRRRQNRAMSVALVESSQPVAEMQKGLLDAFTRTDEAAARQLLDQAFMLFTPEIVALQIVEPTMSEIGRRWVSSELTVWQEHIASNIIQQKLFAVLQSQPPLSMMAPQLVAACAPQEEHQLGLIIFSLIARRQGWRVAYLGQGTPLADIVDLARTAKPNAIIVSVTTVIGLTGLIPWLSPGNRPTAPIAFGGRMLNLLPGLREHLPGGYLGDDVLSAVQNLNALESRDDCWTPSKKVWNLVSVLQARRLEIAGETSAQFMAHAPSHRHWDTAHINYATLFLIDSLSCALAFDVPDLMDLEHEWLAEAMPPRAVMQSMLDKHLAMFKATLEKRLTLEQRRLVVPLLERM